MMNITELQQSDFAEANEIIEMKNAFDAYENLLQVAGVKLSDGYIKIKKEFEQSNHSLHLSQLILTKTNEAKTCAIFDYLTLTNSELLHKHFHSPIERLEKEFKLLTGNVDRVAYHNDGSITVVEIKGFGSLRDHAQAIGQVLLYAEAMRELKQSNQVYKAIVLSGNRDPWIEAVCKSSEIAYINIPRAMIKTLEDCAKINKAILNQELIV